MSAVEQFIADSEEEATVLREARHLNREAFEDRPQCDEILSRHARHWELSRLAMIDRNILRLSVHELRQGDTPFKVVIAEALKLAAEFSTAESPRFINGVLDSVAKEIAKETEEA
jgi:N utilization substance protein B